MKLTDLQELATGFAMDHMLLKAGAVSTSSEVRENKAQRYVVTFVEWSKNLDGKGHRAFETIASTRSIGLRATCARVLAAFIVRHCGASSVTVAIDGAVTIRETRPERTRDGGKKRS